MKWLSPGVNVADAAFDDIGLNIQLSDGAITLDWVSLVVSLTVNAFATLLIGLKAWWVGYWCHEDNTSQLKCIQGFISKFQFCESYTDTTLSSEESPSYPGWIGTGILSRSGLWAIYLCRLVTDLNLDCLCCPQWGGDQQYWPRNTSVLCICNIYSSG